MQKGQIIKALSGFYYIRTDSGRVYQTRARGVFRLQKVTPLVGDYVEFESDNEEEGTVTKVLPRRNELTRPPIANIDIGVVVMSVVEPQLSTLLLDRFLVALSEQQLMPIIYFSKLDLATEEQLQELEEIAAAYRKIGYTVIAHDVAGNEGQACVKEEIADHMSGHTAVFIGQSGAGKSTLLNLLEPELALKTAETSKALGRGRHTTRHVELLPLFDGLFADTPGFSSLELNQVESVELSQYFPEMWRLRAACRFNGCLHQHEPGCAVKQAVADEEIENFRYQNYLTLLEEIQKIKPQY